MIYSPAIRRAFFGALLIVGVVAFSGCASYTHIARYPNPEEPKTVSVAAKPLSKMSEVPVGAYYDEQHHVVVTGHQKGLLTSLLFGPIGVVVADQMNKSAAGDRYGGTAAKSADLGVILQKSLHKTIADTKDTRWSEVASNGHLQLTPYAVFTVEKIGGARLYAMLRAEVVPAGGDNPVWSGRYFVRAKGLYPLDNTGWMFGDRFANAMQEAFDRAVAVCMADTDGKLNGHATVTAKGHFAFLNMDLELRAILVDEQPDYVVAKLVVGDVLVLSGTHVLDRADYTIKPATFQDPRD